jgi:glycosyltransferase involved in cell wall biosynthesis
MHVAIVHYAAPPTVGGVETLIRAHTRLLLEAGHQVTVLAGRGSRFNRRAAYRRIALLDSKHPAILRTGEELAHGLVSSTFAQTTDAIERALVAELAGVDVCIVHNAFTLHKNLPLTAALWQMARGGRVPPMIAYCHDLAWVSPQYLPSLHEGEPWDLLRRAAPGVRYVTLSRDRQRQFAELWQTDNPDVTIVPNGVDAAALLRISPAGQRLAAALGLWDQDLVLLLPARLTRRKNVEFAIRVTASLAARGMAVRLVVTGPPGPHNVANAAYVRELDDLRRSLGVANAAILLYLERDARGRPQRASDRMIADLYALSDALFFPSKQEGFGIPLLEAGLARAAVFCSDIPPSREAAGEEGHYFSLDASPHDVADMLEEWMQADSTYRLRRRVLRSYTWHAVYARFIEPLLMSVCSERGQPAGSNSHQAPYGQGGGTRDE